MKQNLKTASSANEEAKQQAIEKLEAFTVLLRSGDYKVAIFFDDVFSDGSASIHLRIEKLKESILE